MNIHHFREAKVTRVLIRLALPLIATLLVYELYNMVDTYFVSHFGSELGIANIMVVFPIQRVIAALAAMVATGSSATLSRQMGRDNEKAMRKTLEEGIRLVFYISFLLMASLFFFRYPLLRSFGASERTLLGALTYLKAVGAGSFFTIGTLYITRVMLSFGKSKLSFQATALGAVLNVILDYIFVAHRGMDIAGAGLATFLSQGAGFLYALIHFLPVFRKLKLRPGLKLNWNYVLSILSIGSAALLIEMEDGIVIGVLNNLLEETMGDRGVVILGLITKLYMFLFVTSFGISQAMQPIAAYELGAKNYRRLRTLLIKTLRFSFLSTLGVWGLCMFFTRSLLSLFISNPALLDESVKNFRIVISVFPVLSIYYMAIFYFQAKAAIVLSLVTSIMRQILIMIPLVLFFVKVLNWGSFGVWIAYPVTDLLASLLSLILLILTTRPGPEEKDAS